MAVFNDPESFHPNLFLINGGEDDDITTHYHGCFCRRCRLYILSLVDNNYGDTAQEKRRKVLGLGVRMREELPSKLRATKKQVFEINKQIIVVIV